LVLVTDGALMTTVGAKLSTENTVLRAEAGAVLPSRSLAVPGVMLIPNVPSPLMALMVTVRVAPVIVPPVPVTATVPLAEPVLISVTFAAVRVVALKLASA